LTILSVAGYLTSQIMGADEFDYAKDRIWDLPRDISNEDKLELYKLSFPSKHLLTAVTNKLSLETAILEGLVV
jgi:hypothetical protein